MSHVWTLVDGTSAVIGTGEVRPDASYEMTVTREGIAAGIARDGAPSWFDERLTVKAGDKVSGKIAIT